jgi:hypothetical protein
MARIRSLALLLMVALGPMVAGSGRAQDGRLDFDELIQSTVQMLTCSSLVVGSDLVSFDDFRRAFRQPNEPCWNGSGTVIAADGTILTNAHVATDLETEQPVWLLVLRTVDARSLPERMFIGRAAAFDVNLDLAIVQPAATLDGKPIAPGAVTMRPLVMGAAGDVGLGDDLVNIGYPGIGGETITLTSGRVSGFEGDPLVPELGTGAWIKTDATIAGGNSGGTTLNERGELVGVPTEIGEIEIRPWSGGIETGVGQINHIRPVPEGYELLLTRSGQEPTNDPSTPVGPPRPPINLGPPDPPRAGGETAIVTGVLVSADTGEPIADGFFIVLEPGVAVADYRAGRSDAVFAFATSDAAGAFQLPKPVRRGEGYGVIVTAPGFIDLAKDAKILAAADDPAIVALPPIRMPRGR